MDEHFFSRRLTQAIEARAALAGHTNALRWVNAENDNLPGLIVDHYAGFAVCQFLTTGAEYWKDTIAVVVAAQPGVRGVYERSDVDVRAKEGLPSRAGVLSGEAPPTLVEVWEADAPGTNGPRVRFAVDIARGHKTGFYLDQRDNRAVVAALARR
ncbi:MAG: 23S rRNA (cytosine(1962)-C(5))-methyltransferase RlmI, partial [Chloroflexi bacterium]|nr:23S rRNA (cytosine(1962)-C(5))-methyltransferase RlmI [Chloroflexota bacterium]